MKIDSYRTLLYGLDTLSNLQPDYEYDGYRTLTPCFHLQPEQYELVPDLTSLLTSIDEVCSVVWFRAGAQDTQLA